MNISLKMISMLSLLPMILALAGCSWIIGTLPEPDPVWKAAVGFGPHDKDGCLIVNGQPCDCVDSNERVQKYLAQYMPASPETLVASLKKEHFDCSVGTNTWKCFYSKSQAPAFCTLSYRASIMIDFPAQTPVITAIHVNAVVMPDPENVDNRGCFPL